MGEERVLSPSPSLLSLGPQSPSKVEAMAACSSAGSQRPSVRAGACLTADLAARFPHF